MRECTNNTLTGILRNLNHPKHEVSVRSIVSVFYSLLPAVCLSPVTPCVGSICGDVLCVVERTVF